MFTASTNGAIRAFGLKSMVCKTCTPSVRIEHVFVTLQGIQLRSHSGEEENGADWLEIAPRLKNQPRQIDLMGELIPDTLLETETVPADSYTEVRLQFVPDSDGKMLGSQ